MSAVASRPGQRTKVIAALTTADTNGAYTDKVLNRVSDINRTEIRLSTGTLVIRELSE